jgi:hypothetical protein
MWIGDPHAHRRGRADRPRRRIEGQGGVRGKEEESRRHASREHNDQKREDRYRPCHALLEEARWRKHIFENIIGVFRSGRNS